MNSYLIVSVARMLAISIGFITSGLHFFFFVHYKVKHIWVVRDNPHSLNISSTTIPYYYYYLLFSLSYIIFFSDPGIDDCWQLAPNHRDHDPLQLQRSEGDHPCCAVHDSRSWSSHQLAAF